MHKRLGLLKGKPWERGCDQTHKVATFKDPRRHSRDDSIAFCFSYQFLLRTLGAGRLGFCKISFLGYLWPLRLRKEEQKNCHLLVVTKFWGFIFKLMLVLNFKPRDLFSCYNSLISLLLNAFIFAIIVLPKWDRLKNIFIFKKITYSSTM